MNDWFRNQDIDLSKEILIGLECILKSLRPIPLGNQDLLKAREQYIESTIKRFEEVIENV